MPRCSGNWRRGVPDVNPLDERMHPVGDAPAWSESYYFNFVDPESKIAMFTRMGFRPGDGWADGLHVVYLGGDRVAFTYARRDIGQDLHAYDHDLTVGGLELVCVVPFANWEIRYHGPAQDIPDAAILLTRRKARPPGWYREAELDMAVDFNALAEPHYAASGERGHFEQTGRVRGRITLVRDGRRDAYTVDGYGVRDKSWGPRDWDAGAGTAREGPPQNTGPAPFVNWFSMNFGPALALGGSCFRHRDGALRGAGWIQRDGVTEDLLDVVMESEYRPGSIWHTAVRLTGRSASGDPVAVEGRILTICPTKIPAPGGATFVNEGLAEFRAGGLTGYGISEHWHAVRANGG
jgi:hypothetical protein